VKATVAGLAVIIGLALVACGLAICFDPTYTMHPRRRDLIGLALVGLGVTVCGGALGLMDTA